MPRQKIAKLTPHSRIVLGNNAEKSIRQAILQGRLPMLMKSAYREINMGRKRR